MAAILGLSTAANALYKWFQSVVDGRSECELSVISYQLFRYLSPNMFSHKYLVYSGFKVLCLFSALLSPIHT